MNDKKDEDKWFSDIDEIVLEPLKFKAKLGIGEDAYASLRLKNALYKTWNVAGASSTAVLAAKSTVVASTFFAPTGFLAIFGLGAAAVTPIGWVVAAGVISGGAWIGITSYIKDIAGDQVTTIPNFINTPLDVLALGLFDLIAPLALKIAIIDGEIDQVERKTIATYFVKEWGYDPVFVERGLAFIEVHLSNFSIKSLAQTLAEFQKHNPDCNFKSMSKEILYFLQCIVEADGRLDEREEMAIDRVKDIFIDASSFNIFQNAQAGAQAISEATQSAINRGEALGKKYIWKD